MVVNGRAAAASGVAVFIEPILVNNVRSMAQHGPIFGAMLEEFEIAARLINLDPGI
jgi:ribulose 1,5-bisphosphate synthetase/thiazole synthase